MTGYGAAPGRLLLDEFDHWPDVKDTDPAMPMSSDRASWSGSRYDSATMTTLRRWRRRLRGGSDGAHDE